MSKLKELFLRHWALGLGAAFAVGVFCVWYFGYPQKMMTWEQSSLFIWDREYYEELTDQPQGIWIYLRTFIAQFFIHPMTGAAVLALISGLLLLVTYGLLWRVTPLGWRRKNIAVLAALALALLPPLWLNQQFWHPTGSTDEEMYYDRLLRYGRWQEIVDESLRKVPESGACQMVVRLALFQTGQIGKQEYLISLNGFSQAMNDRTSAFMMSDVYFQTGMINLSQRTAFEAMESIEHFNKSGRALMRLTETNLVRGDYRVALKYIALLEKTLYYRHWAKQMRVYAEHPEQIDSNPTLAQLQQLYRETDNYMFY